MSAILGTSILGAMLACVAVMQLSQSSPKTNTALAFTYWTVFAGCVGGAGAFWSCYERWLGYPGKSGWMSAIIGAIAVSGLGSVIAGSLILPVYGTMFGPLQLIVMIIDSPLLGIIWVSMLMCAHGLMTEWRSERDSIFANGGYAPR